MVGDRPAGTILRMPDDVPHAGSALPGLVGVIVAGDDYRLAVASHFGLGVADTHAITHLDANGAIPQTTLARLMGVTSAGATGVVDRLERADIARRTPDPHDRRRYRVELTERARSIIADSDARLTRVFDGLDPEVVETLRKALPHLADGIRRESDRLRAPDRAAHG